MANKLFLVNDDTPIAMLTVGQLRSVLTSSFEVRETEKKEAVTSDGSKRYEYGIAGIKRLFNCSYPTAHKLKEGIIKPAISQQGRVILIDVDLAIKLFKEHDQVKSVQGMKIEKDGRL